MEIKCHLAIYSGYVAAAAYTHISSGSAQNDEA